MRELLVSMAGMEVGSINQTFTAEEHAIALQVNTTCTGRVTAVRTVNTVHLQEHTHVLIVAHAQAYSIDQVVEVFLQEHVMVAHLAPVGKHFQDV